MKTKKKISNPLKKSVGTMSRGNLVIFLAVFLLSFPIIVGLVYRGIAEARKAMRRGQTASTSSTVDPATANAMHFRKTY